MAEILIADDDAHLQDLMRRALEGDGHSVTVFDDGGAALEHIQSGTSADALIADIDMPVVDGIELAKQAAAKLPDLKILMISGMTDRLEDAKAIASKRLSVLQKPFTLEAVRAEVAKLL